ncbi:hypothetical protein NHX12_024475, partial [Muraenolepis orangiensis]
GGPGNPVQKQLTCLLNNITCFYHPPNQGCWHASAGLWITAAPEEQRLTDAHLLEFSHSLRQCSPRASRLAWGLLEYAVRAVSSLYPTGYGVGPELRRIRDHVSGDRPMSREELLQSLAIIQHSPPPPPSTNPMYPT